MARSRSHHRHREGRRVLRKCARLPFRLGQRRGRDELYHRRLGAGAKVLSEPDDKSWRLREFTVADLDGNQLRVFYDFSWELRQ